MGEFGGSHGRQTAATGIHVIHAYEFANAADRNVFVNEVNGRPAPTPADIGRAARQLDNDTFYVLTNDTPITWLAIGADLSSIDHVLLANIATGDAGHVDLLTEAKHDALPEDNPHGVTAAQAGADPAGTAATAQAAAIAASAASLAFHVADSNPHGVTAADVGADPAGTAAALISAHEAAADPHPVYITPAELPALIAAYNDNQSFEFAGFVVGSQTENDFMPRFSQVVTFAHVGSAYLFKIPFLFSMNSATTDIRVRAEVDNVATTAEIRAELQDSAGADGGTGSGTDQRYARVLLFEFTPTSTTHTIDLEFAASTGGVSPTIYETALYLGRHQL